MLHTRRVHDNAFSTLPPSRWFTALTRPTRQRQRRWHWTQLLLFRSVVERSTQFPNPRRLRREIPPPVVYNARTAWPTGRSDCYTASTHRGGARQLTGVRDIHFILLVGSTTTVRRPRISRAGNMERDWLKATCVLVPDRLRSC